MSGRARDDDQVIEKLDIVIRLLQDLFILEGLKAGVHTEDLRRILRVDKKRINRISKHVKEG